MELGEGRYGSPLITVRVAIIGCGAVGLYYGSRLIKAGAEVFFFMRSGAADARRSGIRVLTGGRDEEFFPVRVLDAPADVGPLDWCIVGIKSTDNASLPSLLGPMLHPATRILTLQNGLGNEEFLALQFPAHSIYGGLCFVCLNRTSPAAVRHIGHGSMLLGKHCARNTRGGLSDDALRELCALWVESGIEARTTDNLLEARWRKLVWNVPFNGLTIAASAANGAGVDAILASPELAERARLLMEEVRAVAATQGCAIPAGFVEDQFRLTATMGNYHPSSLLDFLSGRPVEWRAIWQLPLEAARAAGIKVPELEKLTAELAIFK